MRRDNRLFQTNSFYICDFAVWGILLAQEMTDHISEPKPLNPFCGRSNTCKKG